MESSAPRITSDPTLKIKVLKSLPIEEGSINLAVLDPTLDFWQAAVSLRLDRMQLHDLDMVAKEATRLEARPFGNADPAQDRSDSDFPACGQSSN